MPKHEATPMPVTTMRSLSGRLAACTTVLLPAALRIKGQVGMACCLPSRLGHAGLSITAAVQFAFQEHRLAALTAAGIMTQGSLWTIGFHWLTAHSGNDWCQLP